MKLSVNVTGTRKLAALYMILGIIKLFSTVIFSDNVTP